MTRPALPLVLTLGTAFVACGDPGPEAVASVEVSPATATLTPAGETVQLAATARDADGNPIAGTAFTWSSSNEGVATVDAGLVTAVGSGEATIAATAGGVSSNAEVTVIVLASVSAGERYSCALTTGGSAYCWGLNFHGTLGDGNSNTLQPYTSPVPVTGDLRFISLTSAAEQGSGHTCGVTTGGSAYCWGYNSRGQLGDATTVERTIPVPVAGGLSFVSLAAGTAHTCGVTTGGSAYCWGANGVGALGDGTAVDQTIPVPVAGGLSFVSLTAGNGHTCGVTTGGSAYCWGYNTRGQLGDGTTVERTTPVPVAGGLSFVSLTAGTVHTCGVTAGGSAYCWGSRRSLGADPPGDQTTPVPVAGGLTFVLLAAGGQHTCGVTTGGSAYCWGPNVRGQLGDGTTVERTTPVPVAGAVSFLSLDAGRLHTCGVTTDGSASCWGDNSYGGLGDGTTVHRYTPVLVIW